MSPAKLSRREARMAQIAVAVAELEDRGTCWDAWARERGLPRQAVINARKGDRPCWTGDSRRAAELILSEARLILHPARPMPAETMARIRDLELLADRLDSRLGKLESSVAALRAAVFHAQESTR